MIRLGDITTATAGQAAPKDFSISGIPFIRAGHLEDLVSGNGLNELPKVTEEIAKKNRLRKLPKGSILFAKSGMSAKKNRIYISEEDTYFVSHLAAILPSDNFDTNFLARYLNWFNPTNLILDDAYPSIRLEDINNLKIPFPTLPTQQKIAEILDTADKLRQYNKQLIEKYDALTQSLFLEMFGDPVKNEKGWEKKKLMEVCTKITDGTHKTPTYLDTGVIFLSAKNIKNFELNCLNPKYISTAEHSELNKRCNVEIGDILITKSGSLGMAAKVEFEFNFSIFESLALIKYLREKINGVFLLYFLNTKSTQQQYNDITKGVGVKHLHLTDLRKLNIIVPPFELQKQFSERVQMIEAQKQQAQEALAKSEDLFQSLLQRAFKGELK